MARGPLIILSGPAGSGKTTVALRLLNESKRPLRKSISVTTRLPRGNEQDGVDYHFWTCERFQEDRDRGGFLEWAPVHGNYYGTPRSEVEPHLACGIAVVLVIDVQGAAQVRASCPGSVSIFLKTSTWELLEQRLRGRRTESEDRIKLRLENAKAELKRSGEYDYQVLNDDLDSCVARLCELIEEAFQRSEGNA
jgi:guanylate kinase